jgi:predicted ATPase
MFGTEEKLLPTGENLNSIIQKLKNNHSLDYEKIEGLLRDINPNFKDITFNLYGSKSYLLLREKNLANAISIEHLSDGTLRYLLLLAIFYNPKRGLGICIDEPETGLHPDMINTIADSIKYAAKETQFFIATHSPLLLNAFNLDDVLIFEKDKKNQTKVEYKSEDDFEDWNENSLVGQLWLNGQLGGKRW